MIRAAMYLRQSLDRTGEAVAVARQREDCIALCTDKGWAAVEYVDNDTSASSGKKRPAYERMLADIAEGKVQAVVAWDLDRLHRRPIELEHFMALADRHHLALATVSGDVDLSTAQGRLVARLKGNVAAHEIEHKSARQRRAAQQKAEQGRPQWKTAFGYRDDGSYQLDPVTAPLVAQAYRAVIAGTSIGDVARLFNEAEAYGRGGKPWSRTTASLFLRKPRNAGLREYRGEVIGKGTWPPLVDENTWRAAQSVLNAPGRTPALKSVRRHLLSGLLICGACGHHLGGAVATTRKGSPTVYSCLKGCRALSIRAAHVEPLIFDIVAGRLAMPDAVDLLKAEQHDAAEAELLRAEANTLRTRLDELAVQLADGFLTARQLKVASDRIQDKLDALEVRQQDAERVRVFDQIPLGTPEVADAIARLSPDRYRAVLDALMTVMIARVGPGGREFKPERVQVNWR